MTESIHTLKGRIRDAVAQTSAQGLDRTVADVEAALVAIWTIKREGGLEPKRIPELIKAVESALHKLAPPPPKKVKFADPLRKTLPLSEASVTPAVDIEMILLALAQAGDFTDEPDKTRVAHDHFLDDWRRMIWQSARISDWARFRAVIPAGERDIRGRLSRDATLTYLEAIGRRRVDNITPIPDVAILACARCGQFRGRERVRCSQCRQSFCSRCLARNAELCLPDYAKRYLEIDPSLRDRIAAEARSLMKRHRLGEYVRNEVFVRALHSEGFEVVFLESAPVDGEESAGSQGVRKLTLRNREGAAAKRIFFRALARRFLAGLATTSTPIQEDLFVDACFGLPIEEALGRTPPPPLPPPAPEEEVPQAQDTGNKA